MKDVLKKNRYILEYLVFIIIIALVFAIYKDCFNMKGINGMSMYPTMKEDTIIITDEIIYNFKKVERFDLVEVYHHKTLLCKRIIGLPNELIEYKNNKLYINGKETNDKYNHTYTDDFIYQLKENEYFIMGDNRKVSYDSRAYGAIVKDDIIGRITQLK